MSIDIGLNIGHYKVLSRLGSGGMGEVYRARDLRLDRYVAIKALPAEFSRDPDRLSRFVHEAKILASLNHPGIGAIYGLEELPRGDHCLILELVNGISLLEKLQQGRLPFEEAFRVCGGIAEALGAAHECGVIHRDLKPGNVMLSNGVGVKVLDFGLARQVSQNYLNDLDTIPNGIRITDDEATKMPLQLDDGSTIEGTPGYMSPEQIRGEAQDQRTDIFSFGCVLFECLTGRRAFIGRNPLDTITAVLNDEPLWSSLSKETPESIRNLLKRCLEKNAARRLEHIEAAWQELEKVRGTRLVQADRVPTNPNNLPRETSSFVGREKELAECQGLLNETRLLTLIGIGGCGKTRLARKVAGNLLWAYPHGVWFVDLASLTDPDRLVLMVASALGVKEEPGIPLIDTLSLHLKEWRTLLVLDNCEHLLESCSKLAETLLARCADVKLLATSRERIGIEGESLMAVQSLSLPSREEEINEQAVMSSDAGKLFVDRARAVDTTFELNGANATAVEEICRRLDGIPLAIELAANRVKMLTVDQIRDMIDDRFRLLTTQTQSILPRHQTLAATIQWSYDHLTASEQCLFRRISVFNGGWTLSAATAVAGEGSDEFAMLDTLTRLADKSLIVVNRGSGPEARYTLLETVKQYAMGQLKESGEESEIHDRHLDYYLSLAQKIDRKAIESPKTDWRKLIDQDLENFLSAHAWCDRAKERAEKGLRLVIVLRNYWLPRGMIDLGLRISMEALDRAGAEKHTLLRGKVLLTSGVLAYFMGRYEKGERLLIECLSIIREMGERGTLSTTLTGLALVALAQRKCEMAHEYLSEAIQLARDAGERKSLSNALNTLGDVYRVEGKFEEATAAYEEAIENNLLEGNMEDCAVSRCNLCRTSINRRDLARSREILTELLASAEEYDSIHVLRGIFDVASGLSFMLRQYQIGTRIYGASDALLKQSNSRRDVSDNLFLEPFLSNARESLGNEAFDSIYKEGLASSHEIILAEIRTWLASSSGNPIE
jgi:non-specific serine/threonine protein kinase